MPAVMLMLIKRLVSNSNSRCLHQIGVTLIELLVFIVVISLALLALVSVFRQATLTNADPLIQTRALELAQSQLDVIFGLKYDANTPTGGIPACSSSECNNATDSDMNDVDDYNGWSDQPFPGYNRSVTVSTQNDIKTISVVVTAPTGVSLTLSAQRANF